jgi:hypothetical protein
MSPKPPRANDRTADPIERDPRMHAARAGTLLEQPTHALTRASGPRYNNPRYNNTADSTRKTDDSPWA